MKFHENCLLADDSHEISYLIFFKLGKMSENLSSAAVVIGALSIKDTIILLPCQSEYVGLVFKVCCIGCLHFWCWKWTVTMKAIESELLVLIKPCSLSQT